MSNKHDYLCPLPIYEICYLWAIFYKYISLHKVKYNNTHKNVKPTEIYLNFIKIKIQTPQMLIKKIVFYIFKVFRF